MAPLGYGYARSMDVAVVGGGLVGMSTALSLAQRGASVTVYEVADDLGAGQSGNNSNVVHSGAFYVPGSLKARMALSGRERLIDFVSRNGLPHSKLGKLVVQQRGEAARFDALVERARANGVDARVLADPRAIEEVEPSITGERALWLPEVGITDFVAVLEALADEVSLAGGHVEYSSRCVIEGGRLVANDRYVGQKHVVVASGVGFNRLCPDKAWRIVGFRGSYRAVVSEGPEMLVYGVPDPRYPFLGVHLTPALDGSVTAGPNATISSPRPFGRTAALALRNARSGFRELATRSSAKAMQRKVSRYLPGVELGKEIVKSGVRAQAVDRRGRYADDFVVLQDSAITYVANAPSPGATACLAIGEHIADGVLEALATSAA